jgi:hypothetical protein
LFFSLSEIHNRKEFIQFAYKWPTFIKYYQLALGNLDKLKEDKITYIKEEGKSNHCIREKMDANNKKTPQTESSVNIGRNL